MTGYRKPFKTLADQLALLRARGMAISDESAAARTLGRVGYYRLSGYWYIYRVEKQAPQVVTGSSPGSVLADEFVPGTTFDQVVRLYEFDRRLRLHVLDAIERVEVALRVQLGYTLGAGHPFAHLDPAHLDREFTRFDEQNPVVSRAHWLASTHVQWLTNVRRTEEQSKEEFVKHFKSKYGLPLPVWVVTELLTFGSLATLFGGLKPVHKGLIAANFGVFDENCDGDGATLTNWIANLAYVRNICAHHGRLWNKNMVEQVGRLDRFPDLAHADQVTARARVYTSLVLLAYLTSHIDPESTWRTDTRRLIEEGLSDVGEPASRMGCPAGWELEPIWSASYLPPSDPLPAEHREILNRLECIGPSEVGAIIDASPTPKRRTSAVRYHRAHSSLLGLPVGTSFRYPTFQVDLLERRIDLLAAEINRKLDAKGDPWRVARWWTAPNDRLGDAAPIDLLRDGLLTPEAVSAAMGG